MRIYYRPTATVGCVAGAGAKCRVAPCPSYTPHSMARTNGHWNSTSELRTKGYNPEAKTS